MSERAIIQTWDQLQLLEISRRQSKGKVSSTPGIIRVRSFWMRSRGEMMCFGGRLWSSLIQSASLSNIRVNKVGICLNRRLWCDLVVILPVADMSTVLYACGKEDGELLLRDWLLWSKFVSGDGVNQVGLNQLFSWGRPLRCGNFCHILRV
jgi:hypothetical protein